MNTQTEEQEINIQHAIPKVRITIYTKYIKRILDVVLSGLAIIILSPLLLAIAVLELIIHGRPVLYAQKRPGLNEKIFTMYKFRSMNNAVDENGKLLPGNQRITTFGRFLRRFSLDELPELFCVFTGKMSIIGPRPLLPMSLPYYSERHHMRHAVRPGLSCEPLHSVTNWSWNDQFENDIWYIEHMSFWVDFQMVFAVAREALRGSDYRVNDTRAEYNGENLFEDAYQTNKNNDRLG